MISVIITTVIPEKIVIRESSYKINRPASVSNSIILSQNRRI